MRFFPLKAKLLPVITLVLMSMMTMHASAQPSLGHFNCGSDIYWQQKAESHPEMIKERQDAETAIQNNHFLAKGDNDTVVRIIPVVFHIIHTYGPEDISKDRILAQLNTINEDYRKMNSDSVNVRSVFKSRMADIHVEFRLAKKDPNGNCTDGIDRVYSSQTNNAADNVKSLSRWDTKKYLNIWVVASINSMGSGGTILGYSQFPFDNNSLTDGIVVRADQIYAGNKTLTHEIGHYLGLYHTFENFAGRECGNNCNSTGDMICDTPPTSGPNFSYDPNHNSCTSDVPDLPDMEENYMDYCNKSFLFTQGQKDRIDYYLINSKRSVLYSATNLTATGLLNNNTTMCQPKADFSPLTYTICEGGSVYFKDNSYNSSVINYNWTFDGGNPSVSTAANPVIRFDKAGKYTVKLKVSNDAGSDEISRDAIINVLPAVADIKTPMVESFESNNLESQGWDFSADSRGLKWQPSTNAALTGSQSLFLNNNSAVNGTTYDVTLPPVDLTTAEETKLRFKVAYAQKDGNSSDEMRVYLSTNCGQSFLTLYYKPGSKLATVSGYRTTAFAPADASEWRGEELDLKSYSKYKSVIIKFSFKSGGGNNAYLEDINVGGLSSSIRPPETTDNEIQVYPNPSSGQVSLSSSSISASARLEVYDITGRRIAELSNLRISPNQPLSFQKEDLNISGSGMYYFKVCVGDQSFVRKIAFTY